MRVFSCTLALFFVGAAHGAETLRVVASVASVHKESPPMKPGVYVDFVVHSPSEFQGLPITMLTVGASRRVRRTDFPLGAQFALQLPEPAVAALEKAKKDEEHIQSMIDDGVKLEMISQIVIPAQIALSELVTKPTRLKVR